ncbi:hypothetical protein C8P66_106136 [Humitalea rosea]|uniref:Tetratricopeptide repeat protein n=1 Tax=Humitalea rosea TaxID=990373 RepID=A0A2W7IM11_9PROT|nr:hypothetical protein [Humitalea rosea]PZW48132.1 hypothetical protein C8P66_106136 [Humitalea rosea]
MVTTGYEQALGHLLARPGPVAVLEIGAGPPRPPSPGLPAGRLQGLILEATREGLSVARQDMAAQPDLTCLHRTIAATEGERQLWRFPPRLLAAGHLPRPIGEMLVSDRAVLVAAARRLCGEGPDVLSGLIEAVAVPAGPMEPLLYRQDLARIDLLRLRGAPALEALDRLNPEIIVLEAMEPEAMALAAPLLIRAGYRLDTVAHGAIGHRQGPQRPGAAELRPLAEMAERMLRGACAEDGLLLLRHLVALDPSDDTCRRRLVEAATQAGHLLEALSHVPRGEALPRPLLDAVVASFNAARVAGRLDEAERYAAALAAARPGNAAVLDLALSCNLALGQRGRALRFARELVTVAPDHLPAQAALLEQHVARGDRAGELASRLRLALTATGALHPLRRLHEIHKSLSLILQTPMTPADRRSLGTLVDAARATDTEALPAELRHWARHYRLLSLAAEPALLAQDSPPPLSRPGFCDAKGKRVALAHIRRRPAVRTAEIVFLVAADAAYVRLYGRAYVASVLRHCDVPCVVVLHVIGGGAGMPELGLDDPRILFSADGFEAGKVACIGHDSDGPRAIPVAHLQSIRFTLGAEILAALGRPVIISDIDLLLQSGLRDMLEQHAGADVVLNRNAGSDSFGSHLTANLAMIAPTPAGAAFLGDLRRYLERALAGPHVTRWIDQCGLQMCWQAHLASATTRFGWFDTASDINNVMYRSYAPNPFRFLSLYHGFDMASLPEAMRG